MEEVDLVVVGAGRLRIDFLTRTCLVVLQIVH